MEGRALKASSLGRVLSAFLATYFPAVVDYGFSSALEQQLDDVSGARPASSLGWQADSATDTMVGRLWCKSMRRRGYLRCTQLISIICQSL